MSTLTLTDAAHKYGLDDYSQRTHVTSPMAYLQLLSSESSWTGSLRRGETGTLTSHYEGGFAVHGIMSYGGLLTYRLDTISVVKEETDETLMFVTSSSTVTTALSHIQPEDTVLFGGADTITGNAYNNVLQGWGGDDRIDGGSGIDTAVFDRAWSGYTITRSGGTVVAQGGDGRDTLVDIERMQFTDCKVALDTSGNAGQAFRLYQAAFNRRPDSAGLGYQIGTLDAGHALKSVAQNFLNSPEFAGTFGSLDNAAFVAKLYDNVLHRPPDAAGLAFHSGALTAGQVDRAQLLVNFSESPENQAALIGILQGGMVYTG